MFAEGTQSEMDLEALGEQLATRKSELMNGSSSAMARARPQARAVPRGGPVTRAFASLARAGSDRSR